MYFLLIPLIFGAVEGLTEFLPVSSTGHLILLSSILGLHDENTKTFEVFIQLGAILAVVVLYRDRFISLIKPNREVHAGGVVSPGSRETLSPRVRPFSGLDGLFKLGIATLPALFLGFLSSHQIKEHLFSTRTVLWALIVGGVVMIFVEKIYAQRIVNDRPLTKTLEEVSIKQCFLAGLFQCFALWPGMSRSGSTIVGGLLLGLERKVATELSFLMAVPAMCAATGYDLLKSYKSLRFSDLFTFSFGFVVSFLVAILAIKFFLSLLKKFDLVPFAIYRIGLGIFGLLFFA